MLRISSCPLTQWILSTSEKGGWYVTLLVRMRQVGSQVSPWVEHIRCRLLPTHYTWYAQLPLSTVSQTTTQLDSLLDFTHKLDLTHTSSNTTHKHLDTISHAQTPQTNRMLSYWLTLVLQWLPHATSNHTGPVIAYIPQSISVNQ